MTPRILEARRSTKAGFEGSFDLMRTATLDTTVSMAFKPAAFIVSPDSVLGEWRVVEKLAKLTDKIDNSICNA